MRRVPIEDSFDLHSFLPRDVPDVLADYLEEARKGGWREVRIIHGKGKGVRRAEVQRLLSVNPLVVRFSDAPLDRGGFGATVVLLKS
ncbi:MAG TPA: Smr/MutS family protein [Thermoanaerobaculia bacterium]|nr:Smr/MutS family protein [Thermoanaerobaculia bacterium]